MKNNYKILLGLTSVAAVGVLILFTQKRKTKIVSKRRQEVADEGYEFAYDILYPLKTRRGA